MSVDAGYPGAGDAQFVEHRYRLGVEAEEEQILPREYGVFLHQEDEIFFERDEVLAHNLVAIDSTKLGHHGVRSPFVWKCKDPLGRIQFTWKRWLAKWKLLWSAINHFFFGKCKGRWGSLVPRTTLSFPREYGVFSIKRTKFSSSSWQTCVLTT